MTANEPDQREKIRRAIAAQESLRAALSDAVVDATIGALRQALDALDASAADAEQRKQVTVLFADVSGFTAMSETMDPEDVRNTMNALWSRLDAAITGQGGRVDKHIGDAVMALFGAAAAREEDPENAVRAALRMQKELAEFSAALPRPLRMRIGIHCGPVLLGAVGSNAEFTAMGDTVNLASRLEHAAPVGGILISNDVVRQVWGDFDAKELEPLSVKGKKEPVQVYLVERARPRSFRRRREDIETAMVGRDSELKALQDALSVAREDMDAQMITLVGEAGVGKSRLLYEFDRWCEGQPDSPWYFMGRSSPQMEKVPYSLLRDILSFRFGILESDGAAVAREQLERGVAGFLPDDAHAVEKAHFIGQLIGLDFSESPHLKGILSDAAQIRDRALAYFEQLVAAAAAKRPVVILVEDAHWADERSLDALAHLFQSSAKLRLLAICVTRPALFERRPSWGEGQAYHRRVDLKPLSKVDIRRLVGGILEKLEPVPKQLKDIIVEESGGNPFYVEELIRMLCDEGVIVKSPDRWRVDESRLANFKVPSTLVGVLQTRLDGLPAAERQLIQRASVIGRTFWEGALERLDDGAPADRKALLESARAKEMIFRRESSAFTGSDEYVFKHALLRDVAYDSVLKRLRPQYHLQVAQWLAAAAAERTKEYAGLIAEHYEKAGSGEQAARYLEAAGVQSLRVSALREARSFFQHALDLLPASGGAELEPLRGALLLQLGEAHASMGEYPQARARYEESLASSRARGDSRGMAAAFNGLSGAARYQGDYGEAQRRGEEGLELARGIGDRDSIARSLLELAITFRFKGDLARAKTLNEESLALSTAADDRALMARGLHTLGTIEEFQGAYQEAKIHLQQSIALYREIGNRRGIAEAHNLLGIILTLLADHAEARRLFHEAIEINTDIGNIQGLAKVLDSVAYLEAITGEVKNSAQHCLKALSINKSLGTVPSMLTNLALLARLKSRGDEARAASLVGLILSHPSSNNEGKERAEFVLAELRARMPPAALESALRLGGSSPLADAAAEELLKA